MGGIGGKALNSHDLRESQGRCFVQKNFSNATVTVGISRNVLSDPLGVSQSSHIEWNLGTSCYFTKLKTSTLEGIALTRGHHDDHFGWFLVHAESNHLQSLHFSSIHILC